MFKEINKKYYRVWSLFFWIGVVFCFIFFPVFLLDIGLSNYINTKNEIEEIEAYRKLSLNLEKVLQYGNAEYYYHSLLKKLFQIADQQEQPIEYLKAAIPHLKKRNPDTFNFIVWNKEKGELIESITDEKEHKYILKSIYEVINKVSDENKKNYPVIPQDITSIQKKFSIIRSYIGNIFIPENLAKPLLRGNLGRLIPSTSNRQKTYFWFQVGEKISIAATISKNAIESYDYVDKLIKGLNKNSKDHIKFGMINLLHDRQIIPEQNENNKAELNLALAKYENFSNNKLDSDNYIVLVKILNPFCRVFAYINKNLVYKSQNLRKNSMLIALLIEFSFFLGLWLLYKFTNYNFSMSWKLALLFLYANGLPLIALTFIGYDYLQQSRNILLLKTYDNISQILTDFDSKFSLIKDELSAKLNATVEEINLDFLDKERKKTPKYNLLEEAIKDTDYAEYNVIDGKGNAVVKSDEKLDNSFIKEQSIGVLDFINNATYTPVLNFTRERESYSSNIDNPFNSLYDHSIFFDTIISKKGKVVLEHVVDHADYYYFNFIGDSKNRKFESIFVATWHTLDLQENYLKNYLNNLNNNTRNIKCFAYSHKYGKYFPDNNISNNELSNNFEQILNLKSMNFDKITYKGKNYAAFGFVGKELDQIALMGLFPLDIINDKINKNWFYLIVFIAINLLLTLGVSWLLSDYFLAPIKDLRMGIEAMGQQKFNYRIPIKSTDEFGSLSQVFNGTLESLGELSIATTVQENLFPLMPLQQNNAFIWGKSVTMTRLGGDYFDFFPLNDNEVGVLMGDVAGHGVPAGFLMAKASVLLSEEDKSTTSKLLAAVHKVFYHVKSKKIKRMMTCVYFCINTQTGKYKMANAGHCYPAFINKDRKVTFLEIDGTPLGITKRARYTDTEGTLEDNSFMLLYTDGMLEAHNLAGESIGIQRFSELISNSYSDDPETFYQRIFAGYKEWSPLADDDITMVLVKFGEKSKQSTEEDINESSLEVVHE